MKLEVPLRWKKSADFYPCSQKAMLSGNYFFHFLLGASTFFSFFFFPSFAVSRNGKPRCSKKSMDSSLFLVERTTVSARLKTSFRSSSAVSGKIVCSLIPRVKFPIASIEAARNPRKSRVRGIATFTSLSRKPIILLPRIVTICPMTSPSRSLNEAIDCFAFRADVFCPVIIPSRLATNSFFFLSLRDILPVPTEMMTFSTLGACMTFLYPCFSFSFGYADFIFSFIVGTFMVVQLFLLWLVCQCQLGHTERHGYFDDLPLLSILTSMLMLLSHVEALDDRGAELRHHMSDLTLFPLIISREDHYFVSFFYMHKPIEIKRPQGPKK